MSINEAPNPIIGLFLEPQVKKAWNSFKRSLDNSPMRIGQSLDNLGSVAEESLRSLGREVGTPMADSINLEALVEDIIIGANTQKQLADLITILSKNDSFNNSLQEVLLTDSNFKAVIKSAIEATGDEGMTPQEIKAILVKYIGEENANAVYTKMRAQFSPIPKVKPNSLSVDEFNLTPAIVGDLVTSVGDVRLKKVINKVLSNEQDIASILRKAEELSKTQPIDVDWFQTEFKKIVASNPNVVDKATQNQLYLITKRLIEKLGKDTNGNWSAKRISGAVLIGIVISAFVVDSKSKKAWKGKCFAEKGYDTREKILELQKDIAKFKDVSSACDNYVLEKRGKQGVSTLKSYLSILGSVIFSDSEDGIILPGETEEVPLTNEPDQTPKPVTPVGDIEKEAKKWFEDSGYETEGMKIEKINDTTIKWTLPDGSSGTVRKYEDGSFAP